MLKVEIASPEVLTSQGVFVNDRGQSIDWSRRGQVGYLHSEGKKYPDEFFVRLQDKQAYSPGMYVFAVQNIEVVKGVLRLVKFPILTPLTSR